MGGWWLFVVDGVVKSRVETRKREIGQLAGLQVLCHSMYNTGKARIKAGRSGRKKEWAIARPPARAISHFEP